jgi:hypothetical protein
MSDVYIVHCIDAEGPLYESLEAKFSLLKEIFDIDSIEPTQGNLKKLQLKDFDLGGKEGDVSKMLSSHRVNYNDTWDKIDAMLERIMVPGFRNAYPDSFGGGWVFNWHCMDHVNYEYNPRRRDIGYHNIFDHYQEVLKKQKNYPDTIQWHFHPMSTYQDAHREATSYLTSPIIYEILCRKIIERKWFPTVYRAGFHVERPDSNWFLEQWIPFDISNLSTDVPKINIDQDRKGAQGADWRLAPSDWSIYHPSHDHYQLSGDSRRWIARILNIMNRNESIDQKEMDKAFARAQTGEPTIVGLASHDFRDMEVEVEEVQGFIKESQKKYPEVKFKYCQAIEAFQKTIWPEGITEDALELEIEYNPRTSDQVPYIEVKTKQGKVFGPQPFLAIQTRSRRYIHDNFDFSTSLDRWFYSFNSSTLPIEDVAKIGVAANDKYGNIFVKVIDFIENVDSEY